MTLAALLPYIVPALVLVVSATAAGMFIRSGKLLRSVDVLQRLNDSYEQALKMQEGRADSAAGDLAAANARIALLTQRCTELEQAAGDRAIERNQMQRDLTDCRDENRRLRQPPTP